MTLMFVKEPLLIIKLIMVDKKTQLQAMPISNSEVIKLIRKQYS